MTVIPPSTQTDAVNRAARTLLQGIGTDILVAVLPLVYDAVSGWDGSFTAAYWTIVGISLAKTGVMTAVAYVMRKVKTPAV